MSNEFPDLPLLSGPHIPRLRFERALDRLDLGAARADAPETWRDAVAEMAAAFLLRGGQRERALRSIRRHLDHHPRDPRGWAVLAHFEPVLGAARCAFHGGPVLDATDHLVEMVVEDELQPVGPWLLSYGWFSGALGLDDIARALTADGTLTRPPLPVPGDARAFAWYLLDAGGRPLAPDSSGVVEARQRLQRISRIAFRRYLARLTARPS